MSQKVVLALGGNAILQPSQTGSYDVQKQNIDNSVKSIKKIVEAKYKLAIVHGNGPQVGQILQQNEIAKDLVPSQPLFALNAQSQGYIGFMIQESIKNSLLRHNVTSLLTMVEVDANDEAFYKPQKPIGTFYSEAEAKQLEKDKGWIMGEDAGRGYRRLVPSPKPINIVEKESIKALLDIGHIVISTGGGGIPVQKVDNQYEGIDAVIDKDLSALRLAKDIDADILMILTDVSNVYINFGKENQEKLETISISEAEKHMADGQFSAGSMGPKVEACINFAKQGGTAIICSLDEALEALEGKSGTRIIQ